MGVSMKENIPVTLIVPGEYISSIYKQQRKNRNVIKETRYKFSKFQMHKVRKIMYPFKVE